MSPLREPPHSPPGFEFRDTATLLAAFLVDRPAARDCAADSGLEPVRVLDGRALAIVSVSEARWSSAGPCRQLAVAVAMAPRGADRPHGVVGSLLLSRAHPVAGLHIIDIASTSEQACRAGHERWNLPAFATDVDVLCREDYFVGTVQCPDSGAEMIRLMGGLCDGVTRKAPDLRLLGVRDADTFEAAIQARGTASLMLSTTFQLWVSPVRHPAALRMRALGLDGARPIFVTYCPSGSMQVHAGTALA